MKNIKILITLLVGVIIITEISLRIGFYEQLKTQKYPLIYQPDSIIGYTHIPNVKSHIRRPSIDKKFQLNNHGFIGDDFSHTKLKDEIRIAVVGNSVTEGIWFNSNENYVIKLNILFSRNGFNNVKLVNCSFGGIDKDLRNFLHIKNFVSKYNVDVILFNVGIPFRNDNEVRGIYKNYMIRYTNGNNWSKQKAIEKIEKLEKNKWFMFVYDISFIYRAYCKKYSEQNYGEFVNNISTYREKSSSAPDILTYQYSLQTSIKLLSDLNSDLKNDNIRLIIWPFSVHDDIIELLEVNEILYVSPNLKFDKSMVYKHDGHPNKWGHEQIAKLLYPLILKKLKEYKFIKE